ncbi:putative LIMR family protein [Nannochloris sp. 'desiccata']|nr:putative LIMR family protein [Chlorella desiccata (nom. nud.)]
MNWFLIIVVAVVALLTIALSLYLLVIYQHPEDKNQAWFPKVVVVLGMSVAIYTVLMFPLDVANQQSCTLDIPLVDCTYTFPMDTLWEALYIANMILVFVLIPFSIFFYEADSEWTGGKRWGSSLLWTLGVMVCAACVICIPYVFGGYAVYEIQSARSGILPVLPYLANGTNGLNTCIGVFASFTPGSPVPAVNSIPPLPLTGYYCDAGASGGTETWKVRVSLITYAMAIIATIGWLLFLLFGSIGLVALPLDWIRGFITRPRSVISKAQYIERARDLARRAKDIKLVAEGLRREERTQGRSRKWRRNYNALQTQVEILEEDQDQLETVFPQGEDPAYSWTVTVIMQWVKLMGGIIALGISVAWCLQIILYILIDPPVTPLLNDLFLAANDVFPLFGTFLFAVFVFYLQAAVIKGNFKFGLNLLIFRVHPVKQGATMMSSFLFNVALILLASTACIQFAASAFALYANGTAILNIYGNQLKSLEGLRYIYTKNIYVYAFMALVVLTAAVLLIRGPDAWKKKKKMENYYSM